MRSDISRLALAVGVLVGGLALVGAGFVIALEIRSTMASPLAGTAGYIAKFINATDVDNSALFESGGNIGLGTTTPHGKLDVRASNLFVGSSINSADYGTMTVREDNLDSVLAIHSGNGGVLLAGWDFSANRGVIAADCGGLSPQPPGCSPGQDLAFITDAGNTSGGDNFGTAVAKMIIEGGGNVGIGTETPQSKLHVASGYIQFPAVTGAPPAADCDSSAEAGRVVVRTDGAINLYVCNGANGWVGMSSGGVVGGIADLPPMAGMGGSPSYNYAIAAVLAFVAVVAFAAGGWYARRRWLR